MGAANDKTQQQIYLQTQMSMERVNDVFVRNLKQPGITVPTGIAVLGADVPKPMKHDLLASRGSRFVNK